VHQGRRARGHDASRRRGAAARAGAAQDPLDGRGIRQGPDGAALSRPAPVWSTRELHDEALAVLDRNNVGGWTKPAPRLYPHQWSWDTAFIAIGLARSDPDRAIGELEHLFSAQWRD